MADDRLRLVAEVQDGFTGPLAKLETALGRAAKTGTQAGKDSKRDFDGFHGTLGKTTAALQGMTPVLSGLGLVGLTAGVSLGTMTAALSGFSRGTQQLAIMSKETGLAVDQLRAFSALGERFGVSAETMQGGVRKFADEMSQMRKRYGQTYLDLQQMNLGELVEQMVSSPNMKAALDTFMDSVSQIGDPVKRRKVVEMMLGSDQIAAVAGQLTGRYRQVMDEILKAQGQTTDAQIKAAQRFETALSRVRENMDGLRTEALTPLLEQLSALVEKFGSAESMAAFAKQLEEIGKFARTTVQEFEAIVRTYEKFKEFIGLGDPSKNVEFKPLLGGGGGKPLTRGELEGKRDSIEQQRKLLDANPNAPDYARKRDRMTEELRRVGDELEKLRTSGGATAQPSEFSSVTGGGNPLIHRAGYGGMGGGGSPGSYSGVGTIPPLGLPQPLAGGGGGAAISPRAPMPYRGTIDRSGSGRSAEGPLAAKYPDGLAAGIKQSAKDLGISAENLATVISYETAGSFDPWKRGPTTKWGQYRGLIQWGQPQREKYGVTQDMSPGEQMKAVTRYLRDRGVRPGMGIHQVYGAINAGGVSEAHLQMRDAAAGGAPGTVREKVDNQMGPHRRKGVALLRADGSDGGATASADGSGERTGDSMMRRFYGDEAPVAKAPPQDHRMTIDLNGFPAGTRARTSMGDLFKETTVSKSRQVEAI
ncbi:hypothetical protein ACFZ8E_15305 [Methylobacterium sp. HMF5984]|uniref:hypothetical protein n=1 Tax=Methylobacterium sp. HMF5984 TaxID=3367370 RepID=UPI0038544CFA